MAGKGGEGLDDWKHAWVKGSTAWHLKDFNPVLKEHGMKLLEGNSNCRVFVPLCGKSIDMLWFAEQGCSVVGVEVSDLGIKQFFEENNLEYSVETLGTRAKAVFTSSLAGGKFDAIWDRGSLVAIAPSDRNRYAKLIASILKQDGKCLLEIMDFNVQERGGPPHAMTVEFVQSLYASLFAKSHSVKEKKSKWKILVCRLMNGF